MMFLAGWSLKMARLWLESSRDSRAGQATLKSYHLQSDQLLAEWSWPIDRAGSTIYLVSFIDLIESIAHRCVRVAKFITMLFMLVITLISPSQTRRFYACLWTRNLNSLPMWMSVEYEDPEILVLSTGSYSSGVNNIQQILGLSFNSTSCQICDCTTNIGYIRPCSWQCSLDLPLLCHKHGVRTLTLNEFKD